MENYFSIGDVLQLGEEIAETEPQIFVYKLPAQAPAQGDKKVRRFFFSAVV